MILDPLNSITSVLFYRKIAAQSIGRSLLYLCYLSLLFAAATTFAVKVRVMPVILETFEWLEKTVPPITLSGGKVSTASPEPITIRHPKVPEVAVIIDTLRTEPVTPQMLEEAKAVAYLTSTALYVRQQTNKVEIYDFSKATNPKPVVIDAQFYRAAAQIIGRVLYPIAFAITFFAFWAWKGAASLIYSLFAMVINAVLGGKLEYRSLFNITLYAQTLVVLLQAFFLFMPNRFPFFPPLALLIISAYIALGIKTSMEPAAPAV